MHKDKDCIWVSGLRRVVIASSISQCTSAGRLESIEALDHLLSPPNRVKSNYPACRNYKLPQYQIESYGRGKEMSPQTSRRSRTPGPQEKPMMSPPRTDQHRQHPPPCQPRFMMEARSPEEPQPQRALDLLRSRATHRPR